MCRAKVEPLWQLKPDSEVATVQQAVRIGEEEEVVRQYVDGQDLPYCVIRIDKGSGVSALGYGLVGRRIGFIQHGYYEDSDTSFQVCNICVAAVRRCRACNPVCMFVMWAQEGAVIGGSLHGEFLVSANATGPMLLQVVACTLHMQNIVI